MKSFNKKGIILFLITFLLLAGFHFLVTYFINREGYDPYFSLFFGFSLALIFSFFPISYSSYRDEWVYSEEILVNNSLDQLKNLIEDSLAEINWKLTNHKETEKQLKIEFRLDEKIWQRNERLTVIIQKMNIEWKLTIKSDGGVSHNRQALEPLKNNVLVAKEIIEEVITR
jgi:hypothetical protein